MKCPECQFENKTDAEHCRRCGTRLQPISHEDPASKRFEDHESDLLSAPPGAEEPNRALESPGATYRPLRIEAAISPRTRIFIFSGVFYALLLSYVSAALVSPYSPYAQLATVFQSFWANFLLLVFILLAGAFCLYTAACFCCKRMLRTPWGKPKLGKMLLREGYISKEDLEEALEEQKLRIGEVLVLSGRLSEKQLEDSLERQKQVSKKLGEVLIDLGFSTQKDIDWALHMMERKLGEILRERGMLKEEDIEWLLGQQEFGLRRI